jgi:hypothetical protein
VGTTLTSGVKVTVQFALQQATKAQRRSRDINSTRSLTSVQIGGVVDTARLLYLRERYPVPRVGQRARLNVYEKNLAPTGFRTPDRPTRSESLYRLSYTGRQTQLYSVYVKKKKAVPLQAWTGPQGSRRLRLPDFETIST